MNDRIRRKLERVNRWVPSVVRICTVAGIVWAGMIYSHNDVEFPTYFASVVSIIIIYFVFEHIFIWDRLDKLERGKNGT